MRTRTGASPPVHETGYPGLVADFDVDLQPGWREGLLSELAEGTLVTPAVRLSKPLGSGGMGTVWLAEHLGLKTHVVVKFIGAELATKPEAMVRTDGELVTFGMPAKVVMVIEDQDARIGIGLAIEVGSGEAADASPDDDQVEVFSRGNWLGSFLPEFLITNTVRDLKRSHVAAAQAS